MTFNVGMILITLGSRERGAWWAPEVGPAVLQDTYTGRSPGLETSYGLIGDVPGGYSLYHGSPLIRFQEDTYQPALDSNIEIDEPPVALTDPIILALLLTLTPVGIVLLFGGRSYGVAKAH